MQKFEVAFEEYRCYTTKSDVHAQGWMLSSNFDFWRRWYTIVSCSLCFSVVLVFVVSGGHFPLKEKKKKRGKTQGGTKPLQYGAKRQKYYLSEFLEFSQEEKRDAVDIMTLQQHEKTTKICRETTLSLLNAKARHN